MFFLNTPGRHRCHLTCFIEEGIELGALQLVVEQPGFKSNSAGSRIHGVSTPALCPLLSPTSPSLTLHKTRRTGLSLTMSPSFNFRWGTGACQINQRTGTADIPWASSL